MQASAVTAIRHTACFVQRSQAPAQRRRQAVVRCQHSEAAEDGSGRRQLLARTALGLAALAASSGAVAVPEASAVELGFKKDLSNKRRQKIDPSLYQDGPEGLKYYDVEVGSGPAAQEGQRVVVHFEAKWKGITFITSRQGLGVTGGTPLGFDIGAKPGAGGTLKGLDLGVRGMRVGGRRKLIVPPELGYGSKGVGEIPPDATLDIDVELLSIKKDSRGYQVKLVEG